MLRYFKFISISLILIFFLFQTENLKAQLTVIQGSAMNMTPQQLVQNHLVGAGVTVSNVTYNGTSTQITSDQTGTFTTAGTATTQLGLSGGILMTSGQANLAIGPNNSAGTGAQTGGSGDPDLNIIANASTFDKAVIEFDFIPQFDTVRFRYVFGSEEFFEYCNVYNDAFGFFLSGPGISGPYSNNSINIARMPGIGNIPVTINNICANQASRWTNPPGGVNYQYDGLTFVYTAWYAVQPCSTYHIKLAIGDAVDHKFDSGVFLEENSFSSVGVDMTNNSTVPVLGNKAVEGCNDVPVNFKLSMVMDYQYRVNFIIGGTAVNGVDYTTIPNYVIFPPGVDSLDVIIHPIPDNIPEGLKTVILTLDQISCDGVIKRDTVYIDDYNPMEIQPNQDTTLCFGGPIHLKALINGGIRPLNYQWNFTSGNDSVATVIPPVGNNQYIVNVTDVCSHVISDTALVVVHPVPVANAGSNITIPNGTSTTLNGQASGGYGNYSYSWTSNPPGFNSNQQNPNTGNMSHSIIYLLTVTDLASGCQSEPSQVIVSVEGGPLSINPVASPDAICLGDTTQLFSLSGGGSGIYTYSWSSIPAGFSSSVVDPNVVPEQTTTYYVTVNDGFNQQTGSTQVVVYPLPQIYLGPADTTICIYDTVLLNAGNQGSTYLWSNGSTNQQLTASTTGVGYDIQTYTVEVTNQNGCKNSATITVNFSFGACMGVETHQNNSGIKVYPNPASGFMKVELTPWIGPFDFELINYIGMTVMSGRYDNQINISNLPAGIYILHINGRNFAGTRKIIIR